MIIGGKKNSLEDNSMMAHAIMNRQNLNLIICLLVQFFDCQFFFCMRSRICKWRH